MGDFGKEDQRTPQASPHPRLLKLEACLLRSAIRWLQTLLLLRSQPRSGKQSISFKHMHENLTEIQAGLSLLGTRRVATWLPAL